MDPRDYDFLSMSIQDCKILLQRKWPFYRRVILGVFFAVFLCILASTPTFRAEAKCKKAFDPSEIPARLKTVLSTLPKASSHLSAPSVMKSSTFLKQIVSETGMQIVVKDRGIISSFFARASMHLQAMLGQRISQREGFVFKDVDYPVRKLLPLYFCFHDSSHFSVLDKDRKEIIQGVLGERVSCSLFSFVLDKIPEDTKKNKLYSAVLLPWDSVVKKVYKSFHVKEDRADKDILLLSFTSARQALSAGFLNLAMERYVEVIKKESIQVLQEHLEYFENRKKDLEEGYATFLKDHELYLQQSLRSEGFMGLKQEVAAFEGPSEEFYTKLYEVELEHSRLSSIVKKQAQASLAAEKKLGENIGNNEIVGVNKKLLRQQLHQLAKEEARKEELHILEKASAFYLSKSQNQDAARQRIIAFANVLGSEDEKMLIKSKEQLLQYLQMLERQSMLPTFAPSEENRHVFDEWVAELAKQEQIEVHNGNLAYLKEEARTNLRLALKEALTLVEKRLARRSARSILSSSSEAVLEGLNPETAQKLYLDYNRELDAVQLNIRQLCYLQQQIFEPEVELSSLCNLLTDPVSQQMIQKAAQMALELRDDRSRSVKEHERIRDSLLSQKAFLSHHITQMIELQNMRAHLIEEKIISLQRSSVSLLETEKKLLEERLGALRSRMSSSMPKKWRMENELMLKKELFLRMIEGIAHLEESKRVDQNIQTSAFRVLDTAYIPLYLSGYSPLFISFFLSISAAICSYFFALLRLLSKGSLICEPLIKAMGVSFLGTLSEREAQKLLELCSSDLASLRQAAHFAASLQQQGPCVLGLFGYKTSQVPEHIAHLLSIRGLRVIVVDASFLAHSPSSHIGGLLSYLKGMSEHPLIIKRSSYEYMPSGGYSFDCIDLIGSKAFAKLIDDLKKSYDVVVLASSLTSASTETQVFYPFCSGIVAMTFFGQSLASLDRLMAWKVERQASLGIITQL